ncbi:hypothetical protein C8J57DRAFT_192553 [Mycena rebaudengoi]|nr:hypothetical protein C8J57DRAFT_192553 [Mycena rebaudengoi]
MATAKPSDFLRIRLRPPRLTVASPPPSLGSYTRISSDQVVASANFSVPTRWSISPDLCDGLITAVSLDFDNLLPPNPNMIQALTAIVDGLQQQWDENFGDGAMSNRSKGVETATTDASRLLMEAVWKTFRVFQKSDAVEYERQEAPPNVPSCKMDHSFKRCSVPAYVSGVEDKRATSLPSTLADLSRRASCGVLETEIVAADDQPRWWIVANKGALYVGAYDINWIIFAGLTAFCVGHRSGPHMFWSDPLLNRRDEGDEVTAATVDPPMAVSHIFGDEPHPTTPQTSVLLLYLAVALRGADDKGSPWVHVMFPQLCALSFTLPTTASQPHPQFSHTGRVIDVYTEEHSASGESDSGDNYSPSSGSDRSLAPTPLLSGPHQFTGKWYGDLRHPNGYAVKILHYLTSSYESSVYAGELLQKGQTVSAVAVKVSNDPNALLAEFRRYRALQKFMGDSIPRCYGLCVDWNAAYLVTNLISNHTPSRKLSKAERGAIYAALRKMHQAGWAHNDIVDNGSRIPRNLLWNSEGRPVVIDLVTATRHTCRDGCNELIRLQSALKLTNHDIAIWAR